MLAPAGFARLSAIYGGTYMLHRPIEGFEYGEDGNIIGTQPLGPPKFPNFLPHFRLYQVVSLHMCLLPHKYRKILKMLPELIS